MATSARLEELKKKFDESPRRYFAPLANEFRKLGDLTQAVAICRAHLPNQPGHVSGHIVLAQALYEARDLAESRLAFEGALDLDPENLIALRYLGDIAREDGASDLARSWYERVLDADPRNDEIATLLAALPLATNAPDAQAEQQATESSPETAPSEWAQPLDDSGDPQDAPESYVAHAAAAADPSPLAAPLAPLSGPDEEIEDEFVLLNSLEASSAAHESSDVAPSALSFDLVDDAAAHPAPVAAAALPDPFAEAFDVADEPAPRSESAISLGDLEAIAEPSDDWFQNPVEGVPPETSVQDKAEEFFPDLKSVTPTASPAVAVPLLELDGFALAMNVTTDDSIVEEVDDRSSEVGTSTVAPASGLDVPLAATLEADTTLGLGSEELALVDGVADGLADGVADEVDDEVAEGFAEAVAEASPPVESSLEAAAEHRAESEHEIASAAPAPPSLSFNPWAVTPSLDPAPAISAGGWTFPGETADAGDEEESISVSEHSSHTEAEEELIGEEPGVRSEWDEEGTAAPSHTEAAYARTPEWVAPVSEPTPSAFVTETMAELYLKQGFVAEALAIYRQLLEQSPDDQSLRDRIEALDRVGTADAPVSEQAASPKVDPLGQSARSFFAHFARREPRQGNSREHGVISSELAPPIDATPAPEARDERYEGVARSAEAMTTPDADQPRVADSLETLFGDTEVSGADSSAAGTLAAAFSADPPRESAGSSSVRHGNSGEELSLRHLFGEVDERSSGAVSLDEFFSGGRRGSELPTEGDAPAGAERADIEQFTAWLEGLKKK